MNKPILTICIPTIPARWEYCHRLLRTLLPQIRGEPVQVLVDCDDRDVSVGVKRNRMLQAATGQYVCFIDDDDMISSVYVERIVNALYNTSGVPDYVTFNVLRSIDDIRPAAWAPRMPNHLTPVRTVLARIAGFPDRDYGEDNDYAERLAGLNLLAGPHINEVLYTYLFRSARVDEETRAPFDAKARKPA